MPAARHYPVSLASRPWHSQCIAGSLDNFDPPAHTDNMARGDETLPVTDKKCESATPVRGFNWAPYHGRSNTALPVPWACLHV